MLLIFLLCLSAHAEVRLAVWQPFGYQYSYIVPVREGESLEQAVHRYQAAASFNFDLRKNLLSRSLKLGTGKLVEFGSEADVGPRALLMANKAQDMQRAQQYVNNVGQHLRAENIKPYVLPLAGDVGLSAAEAGEFRRKVAQEFDLLVGLGGDDIAPRLYGEPVAGARGNMSLTRDLAEARMIRAFTEAERGFYLGICRGSQILAVTVGCTLIQDIPAELGLNFHGKGAHDVFINAEASQHLAKIYPGRTVIRAPTLHHESADTAGNELLRVVATDGYGVVEATELTSGHGVAVQYHPEIDEPNRREFFAYMAERAREAHVVRAYENCPANFSALLKR